MKLVQWTLFIDMLGYRDINGSIDSDASAHEFISFMETNAKILDFTNAPHVVEQYKNNKEFNLYGYYDVSHCFVSDSLIVTYKPKETAEPDNPEISLMHSANALFIISLRLQTFIYHCYYEKGLFLRGGVSNKYCCISGSFAVGEGLIEAYEAESSLAKHPRIILHPSVEKDVNLLKKIEFLGEKMYGGKGIIQKDHSDGRFFIDHLGYAIATADRSIPMIKFAAKAHPENHANHLRTVQNMIQKHAEQIEKKIEELRMRINDAGDNDDKRMKLESVLTKFEWLKQYHNEKMKKNPWIKGELVK